MSEVERNRIAELLEEASAEKNEKPTARRLKQDDWPSSYYQVRKNFEDTANLTWRLGYDTSDWGKDGENLGYELRGLEHELGRSPILQEARTKVKRGVEGSDLEDAGITYITYGRRPIEPERENEIVEDLKHRMLIEGEGIKSLENSDSYTRPEVSMFAEGYLPWIDETEGEGRFRYERSSGVIEHLANGSDSLREVADEYGIQPSDLRCVGELKNEDLIETNPGVGTELTEKGRELYERELDS